MLTIGCDLVCGIYINQTELAAMTSMKLKLCSYDGEVFEVDQDGVKTMLEDLGIDESENQEVIPIYTVNSKTLQKVIHRISQKP